jgi:hypothetical protein
VGFVSGAVAAQEIGVQLYQYATYVDKFVFNRLYKVACVCMQMNEYLAKCDAALSTLTWRL